MPTRLTSRRVRGCVPWVFTSAKMTRLVRGAHSELVHVAFAQRDHAGLIEPSDNGCVIGATKSASIFEAHVVGKPWVQKISLCNIGIPSSGFSSPSRRASSAFVAALIARSSLEDITAFSSGFRSEIRLRASRVSSTLETSPAASCCAGRQPFRRMSSLIDHPRNEKVILFRGGSVVHKALALDQGRDAIGTKRLRFHAGIYHGLHAIGVHGGECLKSAKV